MIHVEMEKKIQKKKHYILSIYDSKENIDSFIKKNLIHMDASNI